MKPDRGCGPGRARSAAPLRRSGAAAGAGNGMTWAGGRARARAGAGARLRRFAGAGGGRGRAGRLGRGRSGAASSRLGFGGCPLLFFGLLDGLRLSGPSARGGGGPGPRRPRRSAAGGRRGRGEPAESRPGRVDDDAAHDPEQLVELGGVYRRARRVHGGWDTIIKRGCHRQLPARACRTWSCNLRRRTRCATVYSVLVRVLQESAAVTIISRTVTPRGRVSQGLEGAFEDQDASRFAGSSRSSTRRRISFPDPITSIVGPERLRQVEHRRRHPLGHGRAVGQAPARPRHGGRDLRRLREPRARPASPRCR